MHTKLLTLKAWMKQIIEQWFERADVSMDKNGKAMNVFPVAKGSRMDAKSGNRLVFFNNLTPKITHMVTFSGISLNYHG